MAVIKKEESRFHVEQQEIGNVNLKETLEKIELKYIKEY